MRSCSDSLFHPGFLAAWTSQGFPPIPASPSRILFRIVRIPGGQSPVPLRLARNSSTWPSLVSAFRVERWTSIYPVTLVSAFLEVRTISDRSRSRRSNCSHPSAVSPFIVAFERGIVDWLLCGQPDLQFRRRPARQGLLLDVKITHRRIIFYSVISIGVLGLLG